MIRKLLLILSLSVLCVLLLCACGADNMPHEVQGSSSSSVNDSAVHPESAISESTAETPPDLPADPASETASDVESKKDIAISLIGQDVSLLYEALGEPISAEYSLSCNGPGDDGLLTYDGFIVFTYRENGVETVFDVL